MSLVSTLRRPTRLPSTLIYGCAHQIARPHLLLLILVDPTARLLNAGIAAEAEEDDKAKKANRAPAQDQREDQHIVVVARRRRWLDRRDLTSRRVEQC